MQIGMFLTLGLFVFPSRLPPVVGMGLLLSLFLLLVARPVSVFGALLFMRITLAEKFMVAWSGLRGAVPIILATFPLLAQAPGADLIFHLVFFVVLTSVLVQGMSIGWMARWLGVNQATPTLPHYPLEFIPDVSVNSHLVELTIPRHSPVVDQSIMELGLPTGVLVVLVRRGPESIVPDGGTCLEAGDRLLLLANSNALATVQQQIAA
jgi:cell volume regulation protein A